MESGHSSEELKGLKKRAPSGDEESGSSTEDARARDDQKFRHKKRKSDKNSREDSEDGERAISPDSNESKKKKKKKKKQKVDQEAEVAEVIDDFDKRTIDILERMLAWKKEGKENNMLYTVFVNELQDLNSQEQTAFVEINLCVWYQSESMKGKTDDKPEDLWNPSIEILGAIDVEEYYIAEQWIEHGIVAWYQKYRGTVRVPMDLKNFPFDRQNVTIKFGSKFYGTDACNFVNYTDPEMIEIFSERVKLTEWKLTRVAEVTSVIEWNQEDKRDMSFIEVVIPLRRLTGYYLKNIIGLLFILSVISWAMFIVPPYVLNDRLQISITLFLAQVAFNFVIAEQLPKISYGTYLSMYFILCYSLLGVGSVVNVITFLINRYHPACAMGDDQKACTLAIQIDLAALGIVASLHIIMTLVYIYLGRRRLAGEVDKLPHRVADPRTQEHIKVE